MMRRKCRMVTRTGALNWPNQLAGFASETWPASDRNSHGAHRKHRLAAIKRLDLRLFIDAQHDSTGWWRHVKADNIAHLVDKIIQPQREFPACIRRGSPRQHIPPASASQEPCEDGSRYSPADRPRSWLGHRPVTGTRVPGSKRDLVLEEIFQGINLG